MLTNTEGDRPPPVVSYITFEASSRKRPVDDAELMLEDSGTI